MEIKPLYKTTPIIQKANSSASNILLALVGTALLVVSFISIVALVKRNGNESTTFAATEATSAIISAGTAINPEAEILVLSDSINLLLDRIDSLEDQLSERPQPNVSNPQSRNLLLDRIESLENQLSERSRLNVNNPQPGMEVLTPRMDKNPRDESARPPPQEKKGQAPSEGVKPRGEGVKPPPQEKKGQAPSEGVKPRSEGVKPPPRENNGSAQGRPPREKQGPPPGEKKRSTQGKPQREKKGQRRRR